MGAKIALLRGSMTQAALAAAVGIERTAMNKVEKGERSLNLAEMLALTSVLGVAPDILLYDEAPIFAMRADADPDAVAEAIAACSKVIDDHRLFRVAAGR
jgi:transcriptional regulator with XRE-family HTH domain